MSSVRVPSLDPLHQLPRCLGYYVGPSALDIQGSFCKLEVLFVGVLIISALLLGVQILAADCWKLRQIGTLTWKFERGMLKVGLGRSAHKYV